MGTAVLKVEPQLVSFEGYRTKIPPSDTLKNIQTAVETLQKNVPVAFPTETVYGLGANCQSTDAVQAIYSAKNRPADNPLIIHVSSPAQIESVLRAKIPPIYEKLIEKFWPGPLTILLPLPKDTPISPLCTQGQTTFAVRMPENPIARALIDMSGLPLAAPSANSSTKPSCTEASHVLADLDGKIPLIIDGGASDIGVESTVVDGLVSPPEILRPGGLSIEQIRNAGGSEWAQVKPAKPTVEGDAKARAPGMKYKHYAPKAPVILVSPGYDLAEVVGKIRGYERVALLTAKTFTRQNFASYNGDLIEIPLGTTKKEISHNLFSSFRDADSKQVDCIIVEGVDETDEGLAIMNRMRKAASQYLQK